ncbi:integrase catalytic subunit [Legionella parisiensis]|nr:integrase catalytic subunit [Legionella parisiensis]STX77342.1 integrase catalytic subunit [Legionella parisiensis]
MVLVFAIRGYQDGDTIQFMDNKKKAITTLVERKSRMVLIKNNSKLVEMGILADVIAFSCAMRILINPFPSMRRKSFRFPWLPLKKLN